MSVNINSGEINRMYWICVLKWQQCNKQYLLLYMQLIWTKQQKKNIKSLIALVWITLVALIRISYLNAAVKFSGEEINMTDCVQLNQGRG